MNVGCIALTTLKKTVSKACVWMLFLSFFIASGYLGAQNTAFNTIEELKTEANRLFEEEEYAKCYKLYSQLVSNYPKDPEYNYRLGVCILYCEPDKKKSFTYLQFAVSKPEDTPKDAVFFLAKAYHLNYQFDDALKYYNDYKKIASSTQIKKLQVDKEIKACVNGKRLLGSFADLEVLAKKQLNEIDYFRSYDLSSIGGRLLVKPEDFKTSADKKKKEKSVVFLPKGGEKVFYSSYGDNTENGRDLFYAVKLPNGTFSKPKPVNGVNSPYDEDYPFLHPNGRTLYFASKGHNSMGGYDIFKSTYIPETDSWSQPVNLEFPINSPDDDYLFVTDESEKVAYFSTGRYAPPGKIDVLKVNTERVPLDVVTLKGTVVKENPTQSVNAKITVKNMDNGETIGSFNAENNGNYNMLLPNGGKFLFTVETPGLETQSDRVALPVATNLKPFKQTISYESKILKIINYFDEVPADDSYIQYLKLIEEKARLDVKGSPKNSVPTVVSQSPAITSTGTPASNNAVANGSVNANVATNTPSTAVTTLSATGTSRPTVTDNSPANNSTASATPVNSDNPVGKDPKKGIDNKALVDIARKDAEEATKEAIQLQNDANDAKELAKQKQIEASKLEEDTKAAFANAEQITNDTDKKAALEKAEAIRKEATAKREAANLISDLAQSLEKDALNKQKEVAINNQYAQALEEAVNSKNNIQALNKLEALQKQVEDIETSKNQSNDKYTAIKQAVEEKEKDVAKSTERLNETKAALDEINTTLKNREDELAKAKRKEKKDIEADISNLKTERDQKEKSYTEALAENQKQNEELENLKTNQELANRIKNEAVTTPITNLPATVNNAQAITTTTLTTSGTGKQGNALSTLSGLKEQYASAILPASTPEDAKTKITELSTFNTAIKEALQINQQALTKARTPAEKNKISNELKALEKQKGINDNLIAQARKTESNPGLASGTGNTSPTSGNPVSTATSSVSTNKSGIANVSVTLPNTTPANTEPVLNTAAGNTTLQNKIGALQNQLDAPVSKAIYTFTNYNTPEARQNQENLKLNLDNLNNSQQQLIQALNTLDSKIKNPSKVPASATGKASEYTKQGDELLVQARRKREEAKTKSGTEKETILTEAKTLEKQSNENYLKAAEENKQFKQEEITVNRENIKGLIDAGKTTPTDLDAVKRLQGEMDLLVKQAAELRTEADAQNSYGAKLGAMNNAEEKENEITQKQEQAIFILLKNNPSFPLKKSAANTSNTAFTEADIKKEAEQINTLLANLNTEKVKTLAQMVGINNSELNTLDNTVAAATSSSNANTEQQKELSAVKELIKESNDLLNLANQSSQTSQKVAIIEDAVRKQQEAINRYQTLQTNLNSITKAGNSGSANSTSVPSLTSGNGTGNTNGSTVSSGSVVTTSTTSANPTSTAATVSSEPNSGQSNSGKQGASISPANTNTLSGNTNSASLATTTSTSGNSGSVVSTTNTTGSTSNTGSVATTSNTNNQATVSIETVPVNGNTSGSTNTNPSATNTVSTQTSADVTVSYTVDVSTLSNPDSTFSSITSYFEKNTITLKNPSADAMKEKAWIELKKNTNTLTELETSASFTPSNNTLDAGTLKANISRLEEEAENISRDAAVKRKEASVKKGTEKEQLMTEAKNLENQALAKKVEAAQLTLQVNDAEYNTYTNAITELMQKAKADNLAQTSRLEQLLSEIGTLRKETNNLRQEAGNLGNDAARLGAIENAEEKEAEWLQKQKALFDELKQAYPSYVLKEAGFTNSGNAAIAPADQLKKKKDLTDKQYEVLTTLTNAFNLEYESNKNRLPKTLSPDQTKLKNQADQLSNESKRLLIQASKTTIEGDRKKLYTQAVKNSYEAVKQLNSLTETLAKTTVTTTSTSTTNSTPSAQGNSGGNVTTSTPLQTNTTTPDQGSGNTATASNGNTNPSRNTSGNTNGGATVNPRNTGASAAPRNTGTTSTPRSGTTSNPTASNGARTIKVEGLEVINGNAYSNTKPIPIDEKIPDGLIFRVQVGAFKQQLPNSAFKGLTPVNGQTTPNGYVRYTIGNFTKYENAGGVKNDLRNLGYTDAFVVAYFNGKKISLAEASDILKNEGKTLENPPSQSAGITVNANIPKAETILQTTNTVSEQVVVTKELEQTKDLLYTVQIGVYSKQVTKTQLGNLKPIYTERLPSGLYRYTAGIYNKTEKIISDKNRVIGLGIKDAFTTAYLNGKRIAFAEARQKQTTDTTIRMEAENPIIFPDGGSGSVIPVNTNAQTTSAATATPSPSVTTTVNTPPATSPSVAPFSNGVSKGPDPTPENGIKTGNEGVTFKVQIGAYSRQVPNDVASKFLNIKTWPIENTVINGLYIYHIGSFVSPAFAKKLKDEAVLLGITDAFITVYRDGKKLSGAEASALINR